MRTQFILNEVRIGLRRNLTMTIAVVITVAISLGLLGTAWLIRQQVNVMQGYWYGKIDVSVYLQNNITPAQRDTIGNELNALPGVQHVYYESQAQAYQRFKQEFKSEPDLVNNTSPSAIPESFRVKLVNPHNYDIVTSAMSGQPGVDRVYTESTALKKFFQLLNGLQIGAIVAALVQLGAAVLLIFNTVRVAAFSRRRETGIMRLVGASNLYIQLPFILEGAVAGLIGAALAVGGLAALKSWLIDGRLKSTLGSFIPFIGWPEVVVTSIALAVFGVLLSSIASAVTLRRHLAV